MRLAKSGYYGGDPEKILAAPIDIVFAMLEYEAFDAEYEREVYNIAKESSENG